MDDRTDAVALVKSLYNAIGNKEYARAWSYFSTLPSLDFDTYAAGFATTPSVELKTGAPATDAAAVHWRYLVERLPAFPQRPVCPRQLLCRCKL
jgi:hypothetical protein